MKTIRSLFSIALAMPALLMAQSRGLDPAAQLHPPTDSWPTYSGDLTGRRYSTLKYVDKTTVKQLSLAWVARGFTDGTGATGRSATVLAPGGGGGGRGGPGTFSLLVSGLGSGEFNAGGPAAIRGSILMVDGILYPPSPD